MGVKNVWREMESASERGLRGREMGVVWREREMDDESASLRSLLERIFLFFR